MNFEYAKIFSECRPELWSVKYLSGVLKCKRARRQKWKYSFVRVFCGYTAGGQHPVQPAVANGAAV